MWAQIRVCVGFHFFKPPTRRVYISYPIFQIPLSRSYYETEILSVSSAFPSANKINERGAAAKRTSRSFCTHTRTQKKGEKKSERRMPPNVFCLVIVLFCARQIDKTLATVTKKKRNENSIFNFFIAVYFFTLPTCPAGSLLHSFTFLCATCAVAAETVSNLKKPLWHPLPNLSHRRVHKTAKISH